MKIKFINAALCFVGFLFTTSLCLELGLRLLPSIVRDPLKSILIEAGKIPLSNVRIYAGLKGGTRILLPSPSPTDVVVIGDSIPFGVYVKEEDTFSSQLAKAIGRSFLNLGIPSQSPDTYNQMVEISHRYHPKLLLYCVFANDFQGTLPTLVAPEGNLFTSQLSTLDTLAHSLKRFTNFSRGYQLLKLFDQRTTRSSTIFWSDSNRTLAFVPRSFWDPYLNWEAESVKQHVDDVALLVQEASTRSKRQGSDFLVVLLPPKEMVFGYVKEAPAFYSSAFRTTYLEFEHQLKARKIPVVNLLDPLTEEAKSGKKLFHTIDGHYNEEGHRAIADHLSKPIKILLADKRKDEDL